MTAGTRPLRVERFVAADVNGGAAGRYRTRRDLEDQYE